MRTLICTLCALWMGSIVMAEPTGTIEPPPAEEVAEGLADEGAAEIEVLRDPFWPVGYSPAPPEPEVVEEEEKEEEEDIPPVKPEKWPVLRVRGISKSGDGSRLAIIDKVGIVEEGDIVSFKHDDLVYQWQVTRITAEGISQKRLGVQRANNAKKTKMNKPSLPIDSGGIK